jgi:hypothetical protein
MEIQKLPGETELERIEASLYLKSSADDSTDVPSAKA